MINLIIKSKRRFGTDCRGSKKDLKPLKMIADAVLFDIDTFKISRIKP